MRGHSDLSRLPASGAEAGTLTSSRAVHSESVFFLKPTLRPQEGGGEILEASGSKRLLLKEPLKTLGLWWVEVCDRHCEKGKLRQKKSHRARNSTAMPGMCHIWLEGLNPVLRPETGGTEAKRPSMSFGLKSEVSAD